MDTFSGLARASASFARPTDTTAYGAGDLVANNTTAGSVTAMTFALAPSLDGRVRIVRRVKLSKTSTGVTNPAFALHLFTAAPTVTNGDNAAFIPSLSSTYLGSIAVTCGQVTGTGAVGFGAATAGAEIVIPPNAGNTIYGLLSATAAYAPGNGETITVEIEAYPS